MFYNSEKEKMLMKKSLFLLPIIALLTLGGTACKNKNKKALPRITYGTRVDAGATSLTYAEFKLKSEKKEAMLIATYKADGHCGCWDNFKKVIDEYVINYHTKIYFIDRNQFSEDSDNYGLTILPDSTTDPTFALMSGGKKTNEYVYSNDNRKMFETVDGLRSVVTRIARDPVYMYVNQEFLDESIFTHPLEKVVVQYIWNSCSDCNYCFPNVMVPYAEEHDFDTELWLIDLDIIGLLRDDNNQQDKTRTEYVTFMKDHLLSAEGSEAYGYNGGYVPTTQVWQNGLLVDANTYFNDSLELVDGKLYVSDTFFTEERKGHLTYTDTVLKGIEVPSADATEYGGKYYWNKDAANVYHQPLLEAFFDMYVKK